MPITICFEGQVASGKSTTSTHVANRLSRVIPTALVQPELETGFGIPKICELLFNAEAYETGAEAWRLLQRVFHRQMLQHLVKPALAAHEVVIIDGCNLTSCGFPSVLSEDRLQMEIDLYVVTLCDVGLIPNRLIGRGHADYYERKRTEYLPCGKRYADMEWFRSQVAERDNLFGVDTTALSPEASAQSVLVELERRFGWDATSFR